MSAKSEDSKAEAQGDAEAQPRDETPPTETEKSAIKQCEFYFSDSNLPRDKFLSRLAKEGKGWVPLKTIADFTRIKKLLSATPGAEERALALAAALRKSESLLVVSIDNKFVKRSTPIPQEAKVVALKRSLFCKGLPQDATIESVQKAYETAGATMVRCVRLQRSKKEQTNTGTAFVELKDDAEADKLLAAALAYPGVEEPLEQQKLETHLDSRKKDTGKKRPRDEKEDKTEEAEAVEEEPEAPLEFPKDKLLSLTALSTGEDGPSRESIKELISGLDGEVAFVDFSRGDETATVRLGDGDTLGAKAIVAKATEAKAELSGAPATMTALEGDAETAYWKQISLAKKNMRKKSGGGRGGRARRGGRGGRRGSKRQRR